MAESGRNGDPGDQPGGAWHQRAWGWVVLDGNRLVVAGGPFVVVIVAVAVLEAVGLVPLRSVQPTFYLFSGFIGGNLTLITVVVSINQLVLSQELRTPGNLREQIANTTEYREEVEAAAGQIPPVDPMGFLRLLTDSTREQVQRIGGFTYGEVPDEARDDIDDLVEALTGNFDEVDALLGQSDATTFQVLSVTLRTNYARQINRIRRIRADHEGDLPVDVDEALDRLIDRLREIDIARQYFKSIYLQEDLSALSRILLYGGIPAELAAAFVLLTYTAAQGTALPRGALLVAMPLVVALAFLPLFILASFVLRIATVTQRTVALLPFTTPSQELWPD